MRYTPVALAVALLFSVTASVGYGAEHQPDPRAVALMTEGRAELAAGQLQGAIDSFEAALAIDPAYTAVYIQLAEVARQQDLQGKAIGFYRKALNSEPANLAAISGEGVALVEKGAVEKARRNLARLQSLCGQNCAEVRQLAAAIEKGPKPAALTAEADVSENDVTQN